MIRYLGDDGDDDVLQLLQNMIEKCLEMAGQHGLASIAFPTVGCGRLGYRPEVVASCFSRAVHSSKTPLSVIIVFCCYKKPNEGLM